MSFLAAVGGFAEGLGKGIERRQAREEQDTTKAENAISSSMNQYYSVAAQRREENRKKRSADKDYMQTLRSFDPTLSQEQLVFAASLDEKRREALMSMATSAYLPEGKTLSDLITRIEDPTELDDPVALQSKAAPTAPGTAVSPKLSKPSLSGLEAHQGQYEYISDDKVKNIYSRISGMYQDAFGMTPDEAKRLAYKTTDDIVRPAFQVDWVDAKAESAYNKQTKELVIMESNANVQTAKSRAITAMRTDMESVMKSAEAAFVASSPEFSALGESAKLNPNFMVSFRASKQYKQAEKTLISGAVLEMKKNPQNAGTINGFLNRYMPGRYKGDAIDAVNKGKTSELDPNAYYYLQEAQQEGQPANQITAGVFTGAEIHQLATGDKHPKAELTEDEGALQEGVAAELAAIEEAEEKAKVAKASAPTPAIPEGLREGSVEETDAEITALEAEKERIEAAKETDTETGMSDADSKALIKAIDEEISKKQKERVKRMERAAAAGAKEKARGPVEFDTDLIDTNPSESTPDQLRSLDKQYMQAYKDGDVATLKAILDYLQNNVKAQNLKYGMQVKSGRMMKAVRDAIKDLEE